MQADQLAIHADGRRAGRQPQHGPQSGRIVFADQALDDEGDVPVDLARVLKGERRHLGMTHQLRRGSAETGQKSEAGDSRAAISMAMF